MLVRITNLTHHCTNFSGLDQIVSPKSLMDFLQRPGEFSHLSFAL